MASVRNVFVAVPTRQPFISVNTSSGLLDAIVELGREGIALSFFNWSGDPLISHARNVCLATFLQTDCTDLLFVDDDVSWAPGSILQLVKHDVDVVAGLYRHKKDPESYPVNWLDKPQLVAEKGLLEVRDVPFGFTRLSRACVEKMWEEAKDRPFRHSSAPDLQCRVIFDNEYVRGEGEDGLFFGEDYVFCRRWRELGGKVWIDPELALNHLGHKDYKGHIGNWLRGDRNENVNDPDAIRKAFREVAEALKDHPAVAA